MPIASTLVVASLTFAQRLNRLDEFGSVFPALVFLLLSLGGGLIVFGIYMWERRNVQKCDSLIESAKDLETENGNLGKQYRDWVAQKTDPRVRTDLGRDFDLHSGSSPLAHPRGGRAHDAMSRDEHCGGVTEQQRNDSMPTLDFWHELGSSYSYPAAMRIEDAAGKAGVEVRWRPFLIGPIFKAQGWPDSPFNFLPVKGRYMIRDLERLCSALHVPFRLPEPFPQNTVTATPPGTDRPRRRMGHRVHEGLLSGGVRRRPRSRRPVRARAASLPRSASMPRRHSPAPNLPENKLRLRAETETAQQLGIFGAPTFVTSDGELFWGNDRLEQALTWAKSAAM